MKKKQIIRELEMDLLIANAELKRKTEWLDKLLHTEVSEEEKAVMSKNLTTERTIEELLMNGSVIVPVSESEGLIPFMERFPWEIVPDVVVKSEGIDEAISAMKLFNWDDKFNDKHRGKSVEELIKIFKKERLIQMCEEMCEIEREIQLLFGVGYNKINGGYERVSIHPKFNTKVVFVGNILEHQETIEQDFKQFKEER